jgi:hypothetical protein
VALALSNIKRKSDGQGVLVVGRITASGSYAASGDAVDFSTVVGLTNRRPDFVIITGIAGFIYQYDIANKKMWVRCNTAGGADNALGEHSVGAYAAGVTGDTIIFMAVWLTMPGLPAV